MEAVEDGEEQEQALWRRCCLRAVVEAESGLVWRWEERKGGRGEFSRFLYLRAQLFSSSAPFSMAQAMQGRMFAHSPPEGNEVVKEKKQLPTIARCTFPPCVQCAVRRGVQLGKQEGVCCC